MDKIKLRNTLTKSLSDMYEMKVFSVLAVFLQDKIQILLYLIKNPHGDVNPSELSDKLHVSRPRITHALASLRKKGYVKMNISEKDRRRMCVKLTSNGESFIKEKQERINNYFDVLVEGLGEENVIELNRLIELSMEVMKNKENQL